MPLVKETFKLRSGGKTLKVIEIEGEPSDVERLAESMKNSLDQAVTRAEKTTSVKKIS